MPHFTVTNKLHTRCSTDSASFIAGAAIGCLLIDATVSDYIASLDVVIVNCEWC